MFNIRNRYGTAHSDEKLSLLQQLANRKVKAAREIKQLHSALCFIRAFPDSPRHRQLAQDELARMEHRIRHMPAAERSKLRDTGIVGTTVHYQFSFEVAAWLHRRAPGAVSIEWGDEHDPPGLDEILMQLLQPADEDYFNSGEITGKEWIERAAANSDETDFDWLITQLGEPRFASIWSELYNTADLSLRWGLSGARLSKSLNTVSTGNKHPHRNGMRRPPTSVKKEITRPLESVSQLTPRAGAMMIDTAMASLAVRHRETNHFNHANSREVYVADVGKGVSIAVFGMLEGYRYPLECTMGYLIISNGAPIGYGGASMLFRQANTGVNIFAEYRGSEAAFLWVQVMRVFHHLTGCTRYIANPYQFGADNDEALQSGAFWFYYRLGYRPVLPEIRELARRELEKFRRNKEFRSSERTLRRLTSCDMHLTLPGSRPAELFDERWLETSSRLATGVLNAAGVRNRNAAANRVATRLAKDIGIRSFGTWSSSERSAFRRIAPIAAIVEPGHWPAAAKRSMRELLRAKGGDSELQYARLLCQNKTFLAALRKACRRG